MFRIHVGIGFCLTRQSEENFAPQSGENFLCFGWPSQILSANATISASFQAECASPLASAR